jgi:hypothetical protein
MRAATAEKTAAWRRLERMRGTLVIRTNSQQEQSMGVPGKFAEASIRIPFPLFASTAEVPRGRRTGGFLDCEQAARHFGNCSVLQGINISNKSQKNVDPIAPTS